MNTKTKAPRRKIRKALEDGYGYLACSVYLLVWAAVLLEKDGQMSLAHHIHELGMALHGMQNQLNTVAGIDDPMLRPTGLAARIVPNPETGSTVS